ncbi:general secretion pathway protein GspK [Dyella nitratireducens]|uniref:Type II secretion system protein K n=1 Tax=Dyella nitratireducens TaxID=1849580 RepID=A0ABQ1FRQ3_9GAMM|nr:type II secretion system protein GspK [Dyella nitratireducens]GGA26790.1 type II secretion system protein K [Dyella nitratireducens]GLQ43506.1 type II secretion system protein K [Dyella nitratireducens]
MTRTLGKHQRGVALLLVMWACTLLAILLGGYAVLAHTEGLQSSYQFQQAQAHYAAEAGVMRAIYALQAPNVNDRWIGDGRVYPFEFEHAKVGVSVTSESGKVDLNAASPDVLTRLFQNAGVDAPHASEITQAIVDWRSFPISPQQIAQRKAAYTAAGRDYGPRNGPFASVEELQMVLGVTPDIYANIAPYVTIWSGRASPDPNTAPLLALASVPGMDLQHAAAIIAARPTSSAGANAAAGLVANNGITHSIRSEAELADGTRAILRVTVRLQGYRPGSQAFAVLRWQEGDGE